MQAHSTKQRYINNLLPVCEKVSVSFSGEQTLKRPHKNCFLDFPPFCLHDRGLDECRVLSLSVCGPTEEMSR